MAATPLPDKVVALDQALTKAKIEHAFGGAIALAYYAEPRTTIDIDLNLFVPVSEHERVAAALSPLGVVVGDIPQIEREGQGRWLWDTTPIDVFFSYDPFHEQMREARRRVPFGEDRIPILSPEHLIVCKAAFDRPKDWLDIEQILVGAPDLDRAEVRGWTEKLTGDSSEAVKRIKQLLSQGD
jgi:hypothetical protein